MLQCNKLRPDNFLKLQRYRLLYREILLLPHQPQPCNNTDKENVTIPQALMPRGVNWLILWLGLIYRCNHLT
jgi:hypothetical protein